MTKLTKILFTTLFLGFLFVTTAQAAEPIVYFFRGDGCPHCAEEAVFLAKLQETNPDLIVKDFEIWYSRVNQTLVKQVVEVLGGNINGIPLTIIGNEYFIGYSNDAITGTQIKDMIASCKLAGDDCPDIIEPILQSVGLSSQPIIHNPDFPDNISLPFFGKINPQTTSLLSLTILMGAIDGFNPCAMWILILLITLLLPLKDKKRLWILGTTFIAVSAFVYFIFMSAWLNFLLFIGFIVWIRLIIGAVSLSGGIASLRSWWQNRSGAPVCEVTNEEEKGKIMNRMKDVVRKRSLVLALIGIIALAFSVNLIELMCSAGLPAVYTQILTLSNLATWQYYAYLLLYVFVFMLDDMIIFSISVFTLKNTSFGFKYSRHSKLIGGVIMALLGLILIFQPELLMFG